MRKTHTQEVSPNTRDCAMRECDCNQDSFGAQHNNIANPFTKTLTTKVYEGHLGNIGL